MKNYKENSLKTINQELETRYDIGCATVNTNENGILSITRNIEDAKDPLKDSIVNTVSNGIFYTLEKGDQILFLSTTKEEDEMFAVPLLPIPEEIENLAGDMLFYNPSNQSYFKINKAGNILIKSEFGSYSINEENGKIKILVGGENVLNNIKNIFTKQKEIALINKTAVASTLSALAGSNLDAGTKATLSSVLSALNADYTTKDTELVSLLDLLESFIDT